MVAISVDPPDIARRHAKKFGFTFPFLCDPAAQTVRAYDLLHSAGGPGGADIARPAEFLIDASGTIRWRNLTDSAAVRARPDEALKVVDEILQRQAATVKTPGG